MLLGGFLLFAGLSHLFWARTDFRAQVPEWIPVGEDFVVVASGVVEVALGLALILVVRRRRIVGIVAAGFFVAVFPGNLAQYLEHRDAFGLDTDRERLIRLFFQPVLVIWALWAGESWRARPRPQPR